MGCLLVNIENLRKPAVVEIQREDSGLTVNVGLVCAVDKGLLKFLSCSDLGFLQTTDNGFIIVKKTNNGI